jgi:hypothetical protein
MLNLLLFLSLYLYLSLSMFYRLSFLYLYLCICLCPCCIDNLFFIFIFVFIFVHVVSITFSSSKYMYTRVALGSNLYMYLLHYCNVMFHCCAHLCISLSLGFLSVKTACIVRFHSFACSRARRSLRAPPAICAGRALQHEHDSPLPT